MKVVAINGSPRVGGNTHHAILTVTGELDAQGIETEILQVGNKPVSGCTGCEACFKTKRCCISDIVEDYKVKMLAADGLLLASPVYFGGITGTMKCFLDRVFHSIAIHEHDFRYKVGAALVVTRRAGGLAALDSLYYYLTYVEMALATSKYWNIAHGRNFGDVEQDIEGQQILRILGRNMAWLMKSLACSRDQVERLPWEKKDDFHFIR